MKARTPLARPQRLSTSRSRFSTSPTISSAAAKKATRTVRTKEEADHSLPYLVAVAILDGQVMPEQYYPERIQRADVQELLRRIHIREEAAFSRRFPAEMPCRLVVTLRDGRRLVKEKQDYEGFHSRPTAWRTSVKKFDRLGAPYTDAKQRREIAAAVENLEEVQAAELMRLLANIQHAVPA